MNFSCYINQFRPLAQTPLGQKAIQQHKLRPFIDASCRREPDLESEFPSITALCRKGHFAPLLKVGDVVAYITTEFAYPPESVRMRRLVAVLRVKESWREQRSNRGLEAHAQAAEWYRKQDLCIPSNCMVLEEGRVALDCTDRYGIRGNIATLEQWDDGYKLRAIECGAFHACEKIFCDVNDPPQFTTQQLAQWFGLPPGSRDTEPLPPEKFTLLLQWLTGQTDPTSGERIQVLIKRLSTG